MSHHALARSLGHPSAPIFLIEDDEIDAYFVRRALADAKISNRIVTCRNTAHARRALGDGAEAPVLFILDVLLGAYEETGLDFLGWLRAQPAPLGTTSAMVLTGSTHPDHARLAQRLGATSFLTKPVRPDTLVLAVQALGFVVMTSALTGEPGSRIIERR